MELLEGHGGEAEARDQGGEDVEDAVEALQTLEDETSTNADWLIHFVGQRWCVVAAKIGETYA